MLDVNIVKKTKEYKSQQYIITQILTDRLNAL